MVSNQSSSIQVYLSRLATLAVIIGSLLCLPATAQVDYSTATLRGTVVDPQGAVIADAGVTATNRSTGVQKTAQTGPDGRYQLPALPPGSYDITVTKQGFRKEIAKAVQLSVGQVLIYDAHLKIGEATESVEVSADSVPLIQAEQSQQANTIDQRQVQELPNINRSFTYNVYTVPGVTNSEAPRAQNPGFTGFLTTGFSIGGSNGRNNLSTIDGGENEYGTGQYRVTNLPVEAIQEYQVNRNGFAAEFGFTDGSAINIVTKSGGNLWHGSLYGYFRDQHTEATNFFNGFEGFPKAFNQSLYMGGSLGGPIKKDKLFFFAAYERERLDTPFFNFLVNTPQAQGISAPGLGQNCAAQFADPAKAPDQLCYLNALKASGDPFLVGFANAITPGMTPLNNPALNTILNRDNGVFNTPDRLHNAVVRFDYQASNRDSINLRVGYAHNDFTSSMGGITNGTPDSYGLFVRDFSVLTTWSRTISPSVVNQMLVQIVPRNRSNAIPLHDNGINFSLGSLGLDAPGPGGTGTYGAPALIPYLAHQQRYQFEDNVTWTRGNHNFKFGASYRPANYTVQDNLWFNPEFDFLDGVIPIISLAQGDPTVQGHLIAFNDANHFGTPGCGSPINPCLGPVSTNLSAPQSFSFGIPADVLAGFNNPVWHGWGHYFGSYVQDSWKIHQRLTLNAGVRFDFDGEPSPLGGSFYASPRLGFAWDATGDQKTVIRAGSGVYYAPIDVLIPSYGSLLDGTGRYINEVLTALPDQKVIELWQLGLMKGELPFGHLTQADFAAVGIDTTTPGASVGYSVAPNYRNPYSIQASLSIDRQLVKNLSLELGYNMYHAVHLQMPVETAFQEIAPGSPFCPPVAQDPTCTDASGGPLYAPKTGQFQHTTYASNGSSIYHGFTASVTKRYSNNLQFQANYTWSKTIDDTIDFSSFQNWFRPSRLDLFRAVSVFDVPHIFIANAVYTSPFKSGQGNFLSKILADITLSPILNMHSGLPFSTRTPGLQNGIPLDKNYALPFHAPRDANRGAAFYSFDLNFQKALFINRDRGVRLNAIVQGTNLLNHVNFIKVNDEFPVTDQNFLLNGPFTGLHGKVPTSREQLTQPLFYSKADQPRQVQFGLKLAF